MNGAILTELLEFIDTHFDGATSAAARLAAPRGRYGAGETCGEEDLPRIIAALSDSCQVPQSLLLQRFGRHLFRRFASLYPAFFEGVESFLELLATWETRVRRELLTLYPEVECPPVEVRRMAADGLELRYRSRRLLPDLAAGLVLGGAEYFAEGIDLERHDAAHGGEHDVRFVVRRRRDGRRGSPARSRRGFKS